MTNIVPNIVRYKCEQCQATHTRPVTEHSDGMCTECGSPMRIEDTFKDRRNVPAPVLSDRRTARSNEAA